MAIFSIVTVSILLAFIPSTSHAKTTAWRVAVLYWSDTIPGQRAMRQGLETAASSYNTYAKNSGEPMIELQAQLAGDGDTGIRTQQKQFFQAVKNKVDLIIVQPTDNAALSAGLQAANKKNIPVIAYDQYISRGHLTSYLTSDNFQAGQLDGEYIAAQFPNTHKIKLILVEYPHVSSTIERVDGFLDALAEAHQPYTVLKRYKAVEPISGKKAGQSILRDFPKPGSVDVVFTVNDGSGLAVVQQLIDAGRKEIKIATVDGDPRSVANIRNGVLTQIDSAQFCWQLGVKTFASAVMVLRGQQVAPYIVLPVFPVSRETHSQYLGWGPMIPLDFVKPWPSTQKNWQWKIHKPKIFRRKSGSKP